MCIDSRGSRQKSEGAELSEDTAGTAESGKGEKEAGQSSKVRFFSLRRLWPLAVIACGVIAFFAFGLDSYFTFDMLKQNREWLLRQVDENRFLAVLGFIAVYAAIAGFSLPGAAVTSITGGFLFGLWFGTAWNVIGATLGATLLFLAARTVFADILHEKAGPWLQKVETQFQENAFSYLLFLRLVPVFPFFAVNLVPAFLGVRLRTFVVTTFFGIIPGGFVYTSFGAGLGAIFDRGDEFSASQAVTPEIVAGLVGLAVLSLLPIAIKMWRAKRARH
jgi:uncharacterized membrane protein YdjX (TVP38/TMEM64 family)